MGIAALTYGSIIGLGLIAAAVFAYVSVVRAGRSAFPPVLGWLGVVIWAVGGAYASLSNIGVLPHPVFQLASVLAVVMFAYDSTRLTGMRILGWWTVLAVVGSLLGLLLHAIDVGKDIAALPVALALAAILVSTGVRLVRWRKTGSWFGAPLAGAAFILMGLHMTDYPWVVRHPEYASWGLAVSFVILLGFAIGLFVLLLEAQWRVLALREAKFDSLVAIAPQPIYTLAPDGTIISLNSAWQTVTGHAVEHWLGKNVMGLVHPDDLDSTMQQVERALRGERVSYENRYLAADGEYRRAEHSLARMLGDTGQVIGLVGVARDLTDQHAAEAQHRQLAEQMFRTQKVESLVVLAGGVAHDLNNLLVGVLGTADLALHNLAVGDPAYDALRNVRGAARTASELVAQLLTYAGTRPAAREALRLDTLVEEMSLLANASVPSGVTIRYALDGGDQALLADRNQIRQVILNLVINAAEATPSGNEVVVSSGVQDCTAEELAETYVNDDLPAGRYVFLRVEDRGTGMDGATVARMFDPFFTRKADGHGLGLAATLGIVRGHEGAIRVDSRPNEGTSILVFLPVCQDEAADVARPPVADHSSHIGEGLVLWADDEPLVRGVGSKMLEQLGFEVVVAHDGREALEIARERHTELVALILDLAMPELDGPAALTEIRRFAPHLPAVLCTGYADVTQGSNDDYVLLGKPFSLEDLSTVMQRTLR